MSRFAPWVLVFSISLLSAAAFGAARPRSPLSRVVPDLRLTGVALSDAIDSLRDLSGANIHVNWRALEEIGVGKDTSVNLRVRGVSLEKALNLILSEAGAGDRLAYYTDQGVVEITTRDLADQKMITKVYPVDDLLVEVPDFVGPQMDLSSQSSGGSSGGGSSGSSGTLFTSESTNAKDQQTLKKERADQLVALIMDTIRPEIWRENGGPASVRYFGGNLIVTAPRSVHEALGGRVD